MELIKAIEDRRSIRKFKSDMVSKEMIEDLLNCGRLAPSAKNRQPWFFVVVKDEKKNKIADIMIDWTLNNDMEMYEKKINARISVAPTAEAIKQAPVLILVFRPKEDNWVIGDNLSIGACIQNICLRATDFGIGSLWIRDICHTTEEIGDLVGITDLELNSAIAIGYQDQFPKPRPRKELKDIVIFEE